jgi:AraC family transcriptional regulator of adaptative response/methylated-DNA-[protein]-cysteine methyltransferase
MFDAQPITSDFRSHSMMSPASTPLPSFESVDPGVDYDALQRAVQFLGENWREQPSLDAIADAMRLPATQAQKLFHRWAGLTPKQFVQAMTLDHARAMLESGACVLDAALDSGLSGPGRLHDLFVVHEAMTPGEYGARGAGVDISYGFHDSPFGLALVMATMRGLCGIAFAEGHDAKARNTALEDMTRRWPKANYTENPTETAPLASRIFNPELWSEDQPLRVVLIGTDFEVQVWETLLRIPLGRGTTYGTIAEHLGKPSAARAVGRAVGANPISFVVPCHRVIGKSGALTGYHWGLTRKRAILGWEWAKTAA